MARWHVSVDRRLGPVQELLSRPLSCPRDCSPPPSPSDSEGAPAQELHEAVWLGDPTAVKRLLAEGADVNGEDVHGATPLMLAVELMPRSPEYMEMVDCLLEAGAQPRRRSSGGWSPLDEAVARADARLVGTLFKAAQKDLRQRWDVRLSSMARSLECLPDFECRIRWDFDSFVIPWLNKLAPSDVLHVRKRGRCLRVDSTLASWKRFRLSKRRNLTTLFVGEGTEKRGLFMVNHDKEAIVDMTESLDSLEASKVVEDLLKADAMQWDMSIASLEVSEATGWLGAVQGPVEVNGLTCQRYELRGELGISLRKKGLRLENVTFQAYFGRPMPADACLPELRREFEAAKQAAETAFETAGFEMDDLDSEGGSVHSEVLEHWPEENGHIEAVAYTPAAPVVQQPSRLETRDRLGSSRRSVSGSVWLATDFPIDMEQFIPVLDALAVEHAPMKRLKEILQSESLRQAAQRARSSLREQAYGHIFPVRASVPVNLAIRANMHLEDFELTTAPEDVFELPKGYTEVPRSQLQKTASRAKKRMLIANLAL